jgi:hypothetical protein
MPNDVSLVVDPFSMNNEENNTKQIGFGFIYKKTRIDKTTKELDIFYDWQVYNLDRTLDEQESIDRYKLIDKTKIQKMDVRIFGDVYKINLPMMDSTIEAEECTNKFLDYIMFKAEVGFISDKIYQSLLSIVKWYVVYATKDGVVYFDRKLEDKLKQQTPEQAKATEDKYIVTTVMKEWLDWYYRFKEYQLTQTDTVPIGHEYKITVDGNSYWTMYWAYTPSLRWAMFAEKHDFNLGNKTLMTRQYEIIRKLGWMNYICAPRRAGKTWMCAFLAVREIIRQGMSRQESGRPIRVLYIWLTDQKNKAARDYILNMSKKYRASKMFTWRWEDQRLSFLDQEGNALWVVDFISAKSYEAWVGEYADLILIDEAARIKEEVYSAILPIVTNEGSRLICVSTLDWRTKKNWFYKELIKSERIELTRQDIDSYILETRKKYRLEQISSQAELVARPLYDYKFNVMVDRKEVGLRFTIDDIEYISELQKKISKDKLKEYPSRYLAELYGIFPDEWKIFPYETCLKERKRVDEVVFDYIVMAYDPAVKQDIWAVMVMGYSRQLSKLVLIDEREMPRETYSNHPDIIQQMKSEYVYKLIDRNINKIYLVADITGNYGLLSLFDVKGISVDCKVHYTGGEKPHIESDGIWKVPKEHLVDTLKDVMDGNAIRISDDLQKFIDEMNYFQMTQNEWSDKIKYEAVEWHDDFVNAAMTGCFFVYQVMSEKYAMMKSKDIEYSQQNMSYKDVMEAVWLQEKKIEVQTKNDKYKAFMKKYWF